MTRQIITVLAVFSLLVPGLAWAAPVDPVPPPEKPEKLRLQTDKDGFIAAVTKGYDPDANIITVTVAETDYSLPLKVDFSLTYANGRQVPEAAKSRLLARLKTAVRLKIEMVDGKETVSEIQVGGGRRVNPGDPPIKILPAPAPAPADADPAKPADPNVPADKKEEPAPLKGQLKKVDAEKRIIVVEIDGKEREIQLDEKTKIVGPTGREIADGLKAKTFENPNNIQVEIITEKKDGKEIVTEVKLVRRAIRPNPPNPIQPNPIPIRPIQIRPIQIQPLPIQPIQPVPVEPEK